jgi:MFS family permease
MLRLRPVALVFLPFVAGYYLSYLFRTVNAVIAERLLADLGVAAAELGLLTSAYFLAFASVQLPLGVALDRHGPRRVQSALLLVAAVGAAVFATASSFAGLVIGRALIGFGVAGALMAGLKALVLWFPKERLPLVNGAFVTIGALGALTATAPAEWLLAWTDWRGLFLLLAAATATVAIGIFALVPELEAGGPERAPVVGLQAIGSDARFWRLAPLSASCIGTAWALQGLWAAPWLADVARLPHAQVVRHLVLMAGALCAGAMLLGLVADRLRRRGIGPDAILGAAASLFIAAELALVFRLPLPTEAAWAVIAAMGSATVLSYAMLAELFPKEVAGRANAALNLLHIGGAFLIQSVIGVILGRWAGPALGHYPPVAYAAAFGPMIALQAASLLWFLRPFRRLSRGRPIASEGSL